MSKSIAYVTVLVRDYDEAIDYYTKKLGFTLIEDTKISERKRWVLVSPNKYSTSLLLAKAANEEQKQFIGNQTGGRVFLFLQTNNFQKDYQTLKNNKINFLEQPRIEDYGIVAVFKDLYGNKWDLLELNKQKATSKHQQSL